MRIYRALLRLYPASFRVEYGHEMCAVFRSRRRDALTIGAIATLWLDTIGDTLVGAARLHADILRHDLRYTIRTLIRAPLFAATVALVTALGIGAMTAAFTMADHVLIRPLPFREPDRLVKLWQNDSLRGYATMELSPGNYRDWKQLSASFESMAAYRNMSANLAAQSLLERLDGVGVTGEFFSMLGSAAALGRVLGPQDERPDAPLAVVLSDRAWRALFTADPNIVGTSILLDETPHEVVGVMPRGFYFPTRTVEFWAPMRFAPDAFDDRADTYLYGIARLRRDVTLADARAEMTVVTAQLERAYPKANAKTGATILRLSEQISSQSRLLLLALAGASVCVLLIACANLANLLLARALARQREIALRIAIGAGPERLVRQLLTESLLLAAIGGAAGVGIAVTALPLAARLVPTTLPVAEVPSVDVRTLRFAAAATIATAIAFGLAPALRARRDAEAAGLREGGGTGVSRRTERIRSLLVAGEVAACVVLLVSGGLLGRALWRVENTDPGFRTDGVLTLRTALPWGRYSETARRVQFYRRVLDDVRRQPGVTSAAYISFLPMVMRGGIWGITPDGRAQDPATAHRASLRFVSPGFFETLRIPVRLGRDVTESDTADATFVAVVSESFVRTHWPGEHPIGRRFFVAFRKRIVVGVVGDIRVRGLERTSEPQVYLPYQQVPDGSLIGYIPKDLVIRASTPLGTLIPTIRAIVNRADPLLPVSDVRKLEEIVAAETASRRVQVHVLAGFASVAVILAALGLHGLLSFSVWSRRRELAVRIALGATPRGVLAAVAGRTLMLAIAGIAIGTIAAYVAGRLLQSVLAGVSPADPLTFTAAVVVALGVSLAGALRPALGALRVDPLTALRAE